MWFASPGSQLTQRLATDLPRMRGGKDEVNRHVRIKPVSWRQLRCVFELDGFVFRKARGSHWIGEKPGVLRPVVIPEYEEIGLDIIRGNMRTAGMSRERYFSLLAKC